jgi:uncharacterized protein (DUF302 family)
MTDPGIVTVVSPRSFDATVDRIHALLAAQHVAVFATVDHAGEAAKVGLTMRPTKVIIFGNPKAGTPVMLAAPTAAIDLPLKLLVWVDEHDAVRVAYNTPEYLAERHAIPASLVANLAVIRALVAKVVDGAESPR